jgi:3-hydroxyacyl-CoA dehydrogenase
MGVDIAKAALAAGYAVVATGRDPEKVAKAPELIRETLGYSWDDKAAAKGLDEPMKVADHGPDAKRYGAHPTRGVWRGELRERLHLPA